jgi:hypothetical protein
MVSLQGAAYGSADGKLTARIFEMILKMKVEEHKQKRTMASN